MSALTRAERAALALILAFTVLAGIANYASWASVPRFVLATIALAGLAWVVSFATGQLGEHFGPAVTGILQSTVGNLPELFVVLFALQKHELVVAQTAIVGSILANALLVLGLVIVVGATRSHDGVMRFSHRLPRDTATLLVVTVFIIVVLALSVGAHDHASHHYKAISAVGAGCLLGVYVAWVIPYLRSDVAPGAETAGRTGAETAGRTGAETAGRTGAETAGRTGAETAGRPGAGAAREQAAGEVGAGAGGGSSGDDAVSGDAAARSAARLSLGASVVLLCLAGTASAFVSDWFVNSLAPAIKILSISQAFAGLVIVAIAGNAVENTAGVVLAYHRRFDLAISVVKNSVAQVAAFLFPLLVLISFALSTALTFSLAPVYVGALVLTALALAQITGDGEAAAFEGWALIAAYVVIAALAQYE